MKSKLLFTFFLFNAFLSMAQSVDIRYNQLGYFNERSKIISLTSSSTFAPQSFSVLDANDNVVLSGTSEGLRYWGDAQAFVSKIDLSAITTDGVYRLQTNNNEVTFNVGADIYESLSEASLKYYYYNRASSAITSTHGGVHARSLGHADTNVRVHSSAASPARPTNTIISAPKGWYDAGDYNKYIVNSGISTYTLLAAFEHFESYYQSKTIFIPETGGALPDLLDEVKWNLDWMLAMQEPADGGVYHKLTGLNFSGRIMPNQYNAQRYVVGKSTSATLNFAAVMAVASRVYADYETELPGYSATLLSAAEAAYAWAEANPNQYFSNPPNVNTGEYGDGNVSDEFQWAAVELFITTGNTNYSNDINISSIGNGTPSWQYTDPLALISILHHNTSFSSSIVNSASSTFLNTANTLKNGVESGEMNITMGSTNNNYVWGSNGVAANQVVLLIRAYELTNDDSYLDASYVAADYLLGRNGTGYSYVTGYGDFSTTYPHHRVSDADGVAEPVPGMLSGGPNPGRQDGCSGYYNTSNAGSYLDDWCSYASNEVTINWNAPLAYAVNALNFYQNGVALSTEEFGLPSSNTVDVHPNPTKGEVNISSEKTIASVVVYDTLGRVVDTFTETNFNLSDIKDGLYFLEITHTNNQTAIKRLVKR
ncbi:glycoside hydrolase family 9 protein [uncultured Winogradskyella sp.]|uniref:glycoside hydrolase family 9 protein n=1 Tax=uncultured Winogradskyella sp. TaxID=395353 RepID=UPI00260DB61B|nr:glycoside hydrolase family 9 protein [uncultured Winogradskyella sp.]